MNHFIKVAIGTLDISVANPKDNADRILSMLENVKEDTSYVLFQELSMTGYTCGDLFFQTELLKRTNDALKYLLENNKFKGIVMVGAPFTVNGILINAAFVIQENRILGLIPKYFLPHNNEFIEERYFNSGFDLSHVKQVELFGQTVPFGNLLFKNEFNDLIFGVEICEDMWAPISPSVNMAMNGCEVVFNLSASPELIGKPDTRKNVVLTQSLKNVFGYVYAATGIGESSSECVFTNHNIVAECGRLLVEDKTTLRDFIYADIDLSRIKYERRNATALRSSMAKQNTGYKVVSFNIDDSVKHLESTFNKRPFGLCESRRDLVLDLNVRGLETRLRHIGFDKVVLGLSGGLDSTYALIVAAETFKKMGLDAKNIICVTMPSFATSNRTYENANKLMDYFNVTKHDINIGNLTEQHLESINHTSKDVVYENTQARIRTSILMNLANKENAIVIGTADLSEIALGFSTYNADNMSMYGINSGLPKTVIQQMVTYYAAKYSDIADVLNDVVSTPISPELLENQETENVVGSYEINDFIMHRFLACGDDFARINGIVIELFGQEAEGYVERFFKRFFASQFKRAVMPEGAKIFSISLSSNYDFRMPSDIMMKKTTR